MSAKLLVLRRTLGDYSPEDQRLFQEAMEAKGLEGFTSKQVDSPDAQAHLEICRSEGNPEEVVVALPLSVPIPQLASADGYAHIAIVDGQVMRLVGMKPIWEPFVPES